MLTTNLTSRFLASLWPSMVRVMDWMSLLTCGSIISPSPVSNHRREMPNSEQIRRRTCSDGARSPLSIREIAAPVTPTLSPKAA
nr:MAG TPA: hypothetical protein [Caudoviricetes sp.]